MLAVFAWEVWARRNVTTSAVAHPAVGFALIGSAFALMLALTALFRQDPQQLVGPRPIGAEIVVASGLLFADTWVYGSVHSQALPTVWPVAVIFTVAIAAGSRPAVVTGVGLGLARYVGWLAFPYDGALADASDASFWSMSRIASTVLFAVAGWVAGSLLERQEDADRQISAFRAREEVARTLHDGVLQTLAVIQRRSDDADLISLARTQEHELREYLFGGTAVDADIGTALRGAARRAEQRYGLRVQVVCAPDLPEGQPLVIAAVAGAVNEALTNASKHGGAEAVTVYAEPDEQASRDDAVFVSVKDNGCGFDPTAITPGQGLARSITGRIEDAGGRVEVDGRPDRGTEIRMYV